jgi:hypothetical protein
MEMPQNKEKKGELVPKPQFRDRPNSKIIVHLVVGRRLGSLPELPLGLFPVPHNHIDPGRVPVEPEGQGHAQADGKPLAQGTGDRLHAGDAQVRVALEEAVQFLYPLKLLPGEEALFAEGGVLDQGGMAFGKDKPVPSGLSLSRFNLKK